MRGGAILRIQELMNRDVLTVHPEMTIREAGELLLAHGLDAIPVVDGAKTLCGIFNQSHMTRAVLQGKTLEQTVDKVMVQDYFVLQENMALEDLQQEKLIYRYDIMPVISGDRKLVGIVYQVDLLMYLSERSLFLAEELKAVLNSVYNGVIATNAEGVITLFNTAAEHITGIQGGAVVGRYIDDVIPTTGLRRVIETGVPEYSQQQRIGKSNIITNRSPILKDKRSIGAVAVFQDMTEIQAMAAELETVKKLQSTLESAIESLFEGIVVVDKDGTVTMMNRAYCEFLGYESPKQVIGKHVTEIIPNTRMHLVTKSGKAESGDIQRIGDHNVVVTRIPIVKDGEVVGAVGKVLFKDVKDMKILYSNLNKLQSELEYYKEELRKAQGGSSTIENIIGNSEKMQFLKSIAAKVARSNSTALILGESGTGKELFAQALHNAGIRAQGPFIKVNCAAVPDNLLESELFGYEEGAFTGARKGGKPGKFELANGGTLFLDEIGDMPLIMQAKLLRALQEREVERVGGTKPYKLDVRVIAATNQDLEGMISRGEFRQDLYYRLNVISLQIPPLRERREDIPLLCDVLLKKISNQLQNWVEEVSPEVMALFMEYEWPGNVRELENVLERAANWAGDEPIIRLEHLPPLVRKNRKDDVEAREESGSQAVLYELAEIKDDAEKQAILQALDACGGNRSKAAKMLGINRSWFYRKLHKYNID